LKDFENPSKFDNSDNRTKGIMMGGSMPSHCVSGSRRKAE
jgi:hypothetical protein